jgi:hypothetical protein
MDFKGLIHNSKSGCPQRMLHYMLQQTKRSHINVKGNSHPPRHTVCSESGTHDAGFKRIVPTLPGGNEDLTRLILTTLPQIYQLCHAKLARKLSFLKSISIWAVGQINSLPSLSLANIRCKTSFLELPGEIRNSPSHLVPWKTSVFRGHGWCAIQFTPAMGAKCRRTSAISNMKLSGTAIRFTLGRY